MPAEALRGLEPRAGEERGGALCLKTLGKGRHLNPSSWCLLQVCQGFWQLHLHLEAFRGSLHCEQ